MTRETGLRKGWCPGARRPTHAKDGLLVRLRISGGVVPAAHLRALAQAGRAYGNGLFDLSARANLQMRGVRGESLPLLIETLDGLGLIDENAAAEAVRNVLVSPLAGLDGRDDVSSAAKALEAALAANKDLHALPGKFGFLIDDGSGLSLGPVPADVRFDWTGGKQPFAIGIGGHANEAISLGLLQGRRYPRYCLAPRPGISATGLADARTAAPDARSYRELRRRRDCRACRTTPRSTPKERRYRGALSGWIAPRQRKILLRGWRGFRAS